ncbi:hypothetical protein BDW67DRAFT_166410 [Aspergillus spinulosporus]
MPVELSTSSHFSFITGRFKCVCTNWAILNLRMIVSCPFHLFLIRFPTQAGQIDISIDVVFDTMDNQIIALSLNSVILVLLALSVPHRFY